MVVNVNEGSRDEYEGISDLGLRIWDSAAVKAAPHDFQFKVMWGGACTRRIKIKMKGVWGLGLWGRG